MYIFLLANIIIATDRLSEIWPMTTLRKSRIMEKTRYERTKQMISILDYDAGNIKSVEKAVQYLGEDAVITRDRDVIMASDKVILPGVGSFGDAMNKIREYGLENVIYDVVDADKSHSSEYALVFSSSSRPARSRRRQQDLESLMVRYSAYRMHRDLRYRR